MKATVKRLNREFNPREEKGDTPHSSEKKKTTRTEYHRRVSLIDYVMCIILNTVRYTNGRKLFLSVFLEDETDTYLYS
jgi:hypothetical protein